MGLTGNFRFRKGLRRRAVLQVEEEVKPFWSKSGELKPRWRDATLTDLAAPAAFVFLGGRTGPRRDRGPRLWRPVSAGSVFSPPRSAAPAGPPGSPHSRP